MTDYFSQQKAMVKDLEQSFLSNQQRSTIVEMQTDYVKDEQVCLTSVAFIPDDIANEILEHVIRPLKITESEHHFFEQALALDKGLKNIGVPDNKKYISDTIFWGNITICRFTKDPSKELIKTIKKLRNIKIGKFKVSEVDLITCNSVCYPKSRKVIGKYRLRGSV